MVNLRKILILTLFISLPLLAGSQECPRVFEKISLLDSIALNLQASPRSLPLLVVSDAVDAHLSDLYKEYYQVLDQVKATGTNNTLGFALSTTTDVLDTFYKTQEQLEAQLGKAKRKEEELTGLSTQIKTCLENVKICESNLKIGIDNSREVTDLIFSVSEQLKAKSQELGILIGKIEQGEIALVASEDISILLKRQKETLDNYAAFLITSLDSYQKLLQKALLHLKTDIPEMKLAIARLEAQGVSQLGALDLAAQAIPKPKESVTVPARERGMKALVGQDQPRSSFEKRAAESQPTEKASEILRQLEIQYKVSTNIISDWDHLKTMLPLDLSERDFHDIFTFIIDRTDQVQTWRLENDKRIPAGLVMGILVPNGDPVVKSYEYPTRYITQEGGYTYTGSPHWIVHLTWLYIYAHKHLDRTSIDELLEWIKGKAEQKIAAYDQQIAKLRGERSFWQWGDNDDTKSLLSKGAGFRENLDFLPALRQLFNTFFSTIPAGETVFVNFLLKDPPTWNKWSSTKPQAENVNGLLTLTASSDGNQFSYTKRDTP